MEVPLLLLLAGLVQRQKKLRRKKRRKRRRRNLTRTWASDSSTKCKVDWRPDSIDLADLQPLSREALAR